MHIPVEQVLEEFAERVPSEDVKSFVTVFVTAKKSGGDMIGIIRNTTSQIGDKIEVKREIDTLLAAKKYEFQIMSMVPYGIIAYMSLSFSDFMEELYGNVTGIEGKNGEKILADKVILTTGGKSYPVTGSTGDGYRMAKMLGHTVTELKPSLVPLTTSGNSRILCQQMQGLSLKNVAIKIKNENKIIYEDFGEMLFTHYGVSGPVILSASAILIRYKNIDELLKENKIKLYIDLKPALDEEKLDNRILRDFEELKNKQFKNSLDKLLPRKMIEPIITLIGISPEKRINEITKEERRKIVKVLKNFELTISGFRSIEEAIVTKGGISIKEINPKTMESKIINGLYFAGEIIDLDAFTGGFNLQIAWSTGYVAGLNQ